MPVTPRPPFLSDADVAELHDVFGQGLQTVQNFQDPQLTLTFRRRDSNVGWGDVVTLRPISCRLGGIEARESVSETTTKGTCKVWAHEVAGESAIKQGDRFQWLSHVCVVDMVPPERFGYIAIEFTLLEG